MTTNDDRPPVAPPRRKPQAAPDADVDPTVVGAQPQASVHQLPSVTPPPSSQSRAPEFPRPRREIKVQVNTRLGEAYADRLDELVAKGWTKQGAIEHALKETFGVSEG